MNLKTYEIRKLELHKEEQKRDKALVLKAIDEDDDMDITVFAKFKTFMKNS